MKERYRLDSCSNSAIGERKRISKKRERSQHEGPRRRSGRLKSLGDSSKPGSSSSNSDNAEERNGVGRIKKSSESEASGKTFEFAVSILVFIDWFLCNSSFSGHCDSMSRKLPKVKVFQL